MDLGSCDYRSDINGRLWPLAVGGQAIHTMAGEGSKQPATSSRGTKIHIKSLFAAASLVAQAVFFVGFAWMLVDMFSLVNVMTPEMERDSSLLIPYIRETADSYRPALGIGVLGAIASYIIYFKSDFRKSWYLKGTRILGWLWLPFIPIGTLIGIVLLGARRSAIEAAADDQAHS
jgi:hypothetical protein